MRRVLRESLFLLTAGQIGSLVRGGQPRTQLSLSYEDFQKLQPDMADSSWRGAMSKARQRKWVQSRSFSGLTRFQLTKYGKEHISIDFTAYEQVKHQSSLWTLLILQPQEGAKQQYVALKRLLDEQGAALVVPSVYAWPNDLYSQALTASIEQLGFLPCFIPLDPRRSRPLQLDAFWRNGSVYQNKIRKLEQISKEARALIVKIRSKKELHYQQEKKIGGLMLSGISVLAQFQWYELDSELLERLIVPFADDLDTLAGLYEFTSRS